jgi:superfamily II DNA or RNA helicase
MSAKKYVNEEFDYVILDEIHEYSNNQLDVTNELVKRIPTIALTGTATTTTLRNIEKRTGLQVEFEYTIEDAVRDGILCDYEINVHLVELDDRILQYESKKGKKYTEKRWMAINEFLRNKTKNSFLDNKMINIVQNSISKLRKTKALLKGSGDERVLVFCGTTKMADSLEIPVYHSKEKDEETFRQFCEGEIPKIATVKMAKAGIKVIPINRALFNYMNGSPETACQSMCRVMAKELWNEDKKAIIDVVALKEKFELSRLKTALMWLDKNKIKWIN